MAIGILIADDHAVLRDGLVSILALQDDMDVVGTAEHGVRAVSQARRLKPDVVIMDVAMPGLSGIDAARRILKELKSTRVIMLSMYAADEHVRRALAAGASGYVLKESAASEVVAAIRSVVAGRSYFSADVQELLVRRYMDEDAAASSVADPFAALSDREREVLHLLVEGKSNKEIAVLLSIASNTVTTYRARVMQKLDVHDFASLMRYALRHGLGGEGIAPSVS